MLSCSAMLLAVALVGLMMVGLTTFIFSMGELWGRGNDSRLFEAHSRNVTNFLQDELRSAVLPPSAKVGDTPISAQEIKINNANPETLLTFLLPEGSRLLSWPGAPLPEVVCSLQARDGEGLILLWHSRLETKFNEDPPRETVISPLVAGLEYDYYDATLNTWSTELALKKSTDGNTYKIAGTISGNSRTGVLTAPLPSVAQAVVGNEEIGVAEWQRLGLGDPLPVSAKEGFGVAVQIIPYLVAMLVAISVLRSSGAFDFVINSISQMFSAMGLRTEFVAERPWIGRAA